MVRLVEGEAIGEGSEVCQMMTHVSTPEAIVPVRGEETDGEEVREDRMDRVSFSFLPKWGGGKMRSYGLLGGASMCLCAKHGAN